MNSTPFAILIGLAILHVALMEWAYPYRRYMQRKARTWQRRIQLTESDNDTN